MNHTLHDLKFKNIILWLFEMIDINEIRSIAVIGSGTMGTGIASLALLGGYERSSDKRYKSKCAY